MKKIIGTLVCLSLVALIGCDVFNNGKQQGAAADDTQEYVTSLINDISEEIAVENEYEEDDKEQETDIENKKEPILRKKTVTTSYGSFMQYEYDENGELIKDSYETYSNNYDENGNITDTYSSHGKIVYEYDEKGRIITAKSYIFDYSRTEPAGETNYVYNDRDLLVSESWTGQAPPTYKEYFYDDNGVLIKGVCDEDGMHNEDEYENGLLIFRVAEDMWGEGIHFYYRWQYDDHGNEIKYYEVSGAGGHEIPICDTENIYDDEGRLTESYKTYYVNYDTVGEVEHTETILYEYW